MVKTTEIIINRYPNQSYETIFNQKSGLLIRLEDEAGDDPFWCSYGPELIDISITNWCDRACSFCYKKSSTAGKHLSLEAYELILRQAAQMRVLQVALGGGNPNQHPDFCEILRLTRDKYNIVPSYTTNGRGLNEEILTATRKYCGAVAVSMYEPYDEAFLAVQNLLRYRIKTNIHFLLTSKSIGTAIQWLKELPRMLQGINAVIFLNYKPVGRNPDRKLLAKNSPDIQSFFYLAGTPHEFKVGFDSCSISGIARFMNISPTFIEPCEAGRFSMYISEENKMYPCSFMVNKTQGVAVTDDNMQTVWQKHDIFTRMRGSLSSNPCHECSVNNTCFGGCPVYPEINFCPSKTDLIE